MDEDDLLESLGGEAFTLGRGHVEREEVADATVSADGRMITGSVRDGRRSFRQLIIIRASNGPRTRIDGKCTCSNTANCGHVAAVLLYARKSGRLGAPSADDESLLARNRAMDPELAKWLDALKAAIPDQTAPERPRAPASSRRLVYGLGVVDAPRRRTFIEPITVDVNANGSYAPGWRAFDPSAVFSPAPPGYLTEDDLQILRDLHWLARREGAAEPAGRIFLPPTALGAAILAAATATGRCHIGDPGGPLARPGPERRATLRWEPTSGGEQVLAFDIGSETETGGGALRVLPVAPPYYLDGDAGLCGPLILLDIPPLAAAQLAAAPPVPTRLAESVAGALDAHLSATTFGEAIPRPQAPRTTAVRHVEPVPVLRLFAKTLRLQAAAWGNAENQEHLQLPTEALVPLARLAFDYGPVRVTLEQRGEAVENIERGKLILTPRRREPERRAVARLAGAGLDRLANQNRFAVPPGCEHDFYLASTDDQAQTADELSGRDRHLAFSAREAPRLEAEGWRVEFDASYPYRLASGAAGWWAELSTRHNDGVLNDSVSPENWFAFTLGVDFEGERLDLLPTLLDFLDSVPRRLASARSEPGGGQLIQFLYETTVYHRLGDGRLLPLPRERTGPILQGLLELNGNLFSTPGNGPFRIPLSSAHALSSFAALSEDAGLAWSGEALPNVLELGRRLSNLEHLPTAPMPQGFAGELRSYQWAGYNWFAFLRETGFGGVLADDMGLGKTVQALCFLAAEKEAGRLDRPALIVAPTSVLPNWTSEAARFAPSLRMLALRGPERKKLFAEIPRCDVVLTTFPLLARDREELTAFRYHVVILDEAQAVKNPSSAVAGAASALNARHRFALTGTPMENTLGDVWSLFHFINPELLGDRKSFTKQFRDPIEKRGDPAARSLLARRLRPFMLRRTKDAVARELPPKTEIIEYVEIEGAQRDLYETIRLSVYKSVRDAIEAKGLAKSRIMVLDALLKLRQACCDPRLVKLDAAREVEESAKRDRLMELLVELAAEGRKVLLFSQFTSMLALIEQDLKDEEISYIKLTGETRDRAAPVAAFQEGKAPLFLISLKAGGSGLNLTAADTVIHYDPWWNPAVEDQAADRAWRIGQDKPVFVRKLVARNTVEEGVLELKTRKAALAEALFSETENKEFTFTEADIEALFGASSAGG